MNWVLQLNNSQSVNSFNSLVEKFNTKRSPNQPNQNPNQSVVDRGNLRTQKMCLLLKGKRPVPTRSMKKVCTKNLVLQIDRGNLRNCLKTSVLSMLTMEQGNLLSKTAQVHKVKEQFAPEENRDIASLNTDNENDRAINEENIDFNIPGLPHSAVKRSHGVNVQNLIQKIESHPQRQALQSDLQQHRQFNPFSRESQDAIKAVGNTELCEIVDVEPKAQCRACLTYWEVGIVYCTCGHFLRDDTKENKKYVKFTLDLFSIPQLLHQERSTPRSPLREERRGSRVLHRESAPEEMQEERILEHSRSVHP